MKGLLLKDFYMLKKYCKTVVLLVGIFIAVSLVNSENVFFLLYPVMVMSILPISILAYDEKCKWQVYGETFPYSREQMVSVKYLMSLLLVGGTWLITILMQGIRFLCISAEGTGSMIPLLVFIFGVGLLFSSIILPFVFKLGAEKGRLVYICTIVIICVGSSALSVNPLKPALSVSPLFLSVMFLGICIMIFGLSWLLSIGIYKKREV